VNENSPEEAKICLEKTGFNFEFGKSQTTQTTLPTVNSSMSSLTNKLTVGAFARRIRHNEDSTT